MLRRDSESTCGLVRSLPNGLGPKRTITLLTKRTMSWRMRGGVARGSLGASGRRSVPGPADTGRSLKSHYAAGSGPLWEA